MFTSNSFVPALSIVAFAALSACTTTTADVAADAAAAAPIAQQSYGERPAPIAPLDDATAADPMAERAAITAMLDALFAQDAVDAAKTPPTTAAGYAKCLGAVDYMQSHKVVPATLDGSVIQARAEALADFNAHSFDSTREITQSKLAEALSARQMAPDAAATKARMAALKADLAGCNDIEE